LLHFKRPLVIRYSDTLILEYLALSRGFVVLLLGRPEVIARFACKRRFCVLLRFAAFDSIRLVSLYSCFFGLLLHFDKFTFPSLLTTSNWTFPPLPRTLSQGASARDQLAVVPCPPRCSHNSQAPMSLGLGNVARANPYSVQSRAESCTRARSCVSFTLCFASVP
jgi:hypothetical protein